MQSTPRGRRPGRSAARRSSTSPSTGSNEAAADRLRLPKELLREPLDAAGLDLALVRLHDVAHQAADLLGVGDGERGGAGAYERAQRRLVEPTAEGTPAELRVEAR